MHGAGVLRRGGGWGVKNLSQQLMLEVASSTIVHSTTIIVLVLLLLAWRRVKIMLFLKNILKACIMQKVNIFFYIVK